MSEWLVTVETPRDVAHGEAALVAFSDALDEARGTTGASASLDKERRVISATFGVSEETVQDAVNTAVMLFNAALERAGLPQGNRIHVEAEPIDDRAPALA